MTGGAGFVGSHLCDRLISDGWHVICLDNFFTGDLGNVAHLRHEPNFEILRHDITTPMSIEVDAIFNLACPASPVHYQRTPVHTLKTSVLGALNMLELAARLGVPILQASTSEVYGDPETHPQSEHYWGHVNPIGVRACYDEGKRCAETLFFDFHRQYGVQIRIARIFNTYGPRMAQGDGRVVSNFVVQALRGEPLTIFGDGSQTRSFCYVDDTIDALVRLMDAGITGPINVGNPRETSMRELAELIRDLTESTSTIEFQPLPADDPRQRMPDITRAQEQLNWSPEIDLSEGLKRTIAHFQDELHQSTFT